MSISNQCVLKTVVAGAVLLSLTACANRPVVNPDSRIGQASESIGEMGSSFWQKTKHVLRLNGTDQYHPSRDQNPAVAQPGDIPADFKDEVDLVLVEDEFVDDEFENEFDEEIATVEFNTGPGRNQRIAVPSAEQNTAAVSQQSIEQLEATTIVNATSATESASAEQPQFRVEELSPEPIAAKQEQWAPTQVAQFDLEYEVQVNENLWGIAKRLTGDATNWQQLAALNALDGSGTVYGGQKLLIPGDMLKPDYAATPVLEVQPQATELAAVTTTSSQQMPTGTAVEAVSEVVVNVDVSKVDMGPSTEFNVQAGETLWNLAKRTTGDATNWKQIAAANGMSDEQAALIKYGETLLIPNSLLKEISEPANTTAITLDDQDIADSEQPAIATTTVIESNTGAATNLDTGNDLNTENIERTMTIVPANYQPEPLLQSEPNTQLEIKAEQVQAQTETEGDGKWIMVSGTYYPKAVYNDANFSASLLTRVSPGTKLQVSRAIGPWFEVITDQGTGYVHSRDIK